MFKIKRIKKYGEDKSGSFELSDTHNLLNLFYSIKMRQNLNTADMLLQFTSDSLECM